MWLVKVARLDARGKDAELAAISDYLTAPEARVARLCRLTDSARFPVSTERRQPRLLIDGLRRSPSLSIGSRRGVNEPSPYVHRPVIIIISHNRSSRAVISR